MVVGLARRDVEDEPPSALPTPSASSILSTTTALHQHEHHRNCDYGCADTNTAAT
jgi:hypothetical protein